MSKNNIYVKCPKCGRVAEVGIATNFKACYYCPKCEMSSLSKCWQELIRTRKALDVAVDALKKTLNGCESYDADYGVCYTALEQIKELDNAETHI